MNLTLRLQLSLMMFVQFFVWGAWYVTGPNYLGTIGFTATDFGWTYAVGPIAVLPSDPQGPLLPGSSTLPGYYGTSHSYSYDGPYYGGPYTPYWDRLPYACGVYGYC